MPQKRFAAMIGVAERTVRRWEDGEFIGGDDIDKLVSVIARSEIQGFTLDWLLVGMGHRPTRAWPSEPVEGAGPLRADAKWLELDDLLSSVGLHPPTTPISNETACGLLEAAAAELTRIDNEALRESLFVEIQEWRSKYGCD